MILVTTAGELIDHVDVEVQCPTPIVVNSLLLEKFLTVSGDRQAMHEPAKRAVVPANLLLTLLPVALQSGVRVVTFSRCFTVGYDRVRFRQPVQPEMRLHVFAKVVSVRQRQRQTFVRLALTLKCEAGESVLTLEQTDCYQD